MGLDGIRDPDPLLYCSAMSDFHSQDYLLSKADAGAPVFFHLAGGKITPKRGACF